VIRPEDIALEPGTHTEEPAEEIVTLEEMERYHILNVLEHTAWVVKGEHGAAALLGLPASTLHHRMRKLGIERP
jgi:transcriptional regulator with GAF, ATPase, and Fis domain